MTEVPLKVALRACRSSYVIFGAIFGFLSVMAAVTATHEATMRPVLAACVMAWLLSFSWLASFRLVITENSVIYRTLFRGTSVYPFTDIQRIGVESGINEYSDRFRPFIRLVIRTVREGKPIRRDVNLKVFSLDGVREVIAELRTSFTSIGRADVVKDL